MSKRTYNAEISYWTICSVISVVMHSVHVSAQDIVATGIIDQPKALVQELESFEGAYGSRLSEALLALGLSLQEKNAHQEAIKVFRRGGHLSRVNNGLLTDAQIPFIHHEVKSLLAMDQLHAVDERQLYLHKLESVVFSSGPKYLDALMRQGEWLSLIHI